MELQKPLYFFALCVLIVINICYFHQKKVFPKKESEPINKEKTILWNRGEKISLNQYPFAQEIRNICESIFENADSMYKLIIGNTLIKRLRKKEILIEIIYSPPKTFFPLYWQNRPKPKKLQISRLLIPLTGRFSHPVTIFYSTPEDKLPDGTPLEYEEFNNLINSHAEEEINYVNKILKLNLNIEF